jgi:hypothetical protein
MTEVHVAAATARAALSEGAVLVGCVALIACVLLCGVSSTARLVVRTIVRAFIWRSMR